MSVRIVFVGTSHGVPEPCRRCSSTMIEIGDRRYFIDMGTQAIEDLISRGAPVDSVKGIFITHMHGDHTNGLISFVDLCSWYFQTADPLILLPEVKAVDAIRAWLDATSSGLRDLRFEETREGVCFDDGVLRVTAFRTKHNRCSYAYIIEAEGKSALFSGDLAGPSKDFPRAAVEMPLDLMICESAHFSSLDYEPVFRESHAKRVIINHYAPWNLPNIIKLKDDLKDVVPVGMATDGLEITL
ncbi:MAG: MBL fold metallo-hydrolase [Clostridiales bacterium]|nr:MBL fold metallo-hydrolase [Clostridiales bacterium]